MWTMCFTEDFAGWVDMTFDCKTIAWGLGHVGGLEIGLPKNRPVGVPTLIQTL